MSDATRDARPVRRRSDAVKALAAASTLGVATAIAVTGTPSWEQRVFEVLHSVPRAADVVLWLPMQAGSAWAPPLAALVGWQVSRSWRPTVGSLVTGWGGWWLAKLVKAQVGRGRPAAELPADAVRGTAITDGLGFVSGHSTVAFALAATLSPYLSRHARVLVYGLATTVALSRVVVGAHLPLDVVGGAALGLTLAYSWHLAVGVVAPPER